MPSTSLRCLRSPLGATECARVRNCLGRHFKDQRHSQTFSVEINHRLYGSSCSRIPRCKRNNKAVTASLHQVRKGGYWEAVLIHKHSCIIFSVATPNATVAWVMFVRRFDLRRDPQPYRQCAWPCPTAFCFRSAIESGFWLLDCFEGVFARVASGKYDHTVLARGVPPIAPRLGDKFFGRSSLSHWPVKRPLGLGSCSACD